ncbi:hypothetical protein AAHA92_28355 [Salvia divinorum]|uniref:Uncharacterized protein n=1 Tax=Salvia divinorum TaxID=28513 RepID=A0ABD1FUU2_SALDI
MTIVVRRAGNIYTSSLDNKEKQFKSSIRKKKRGVIKKFQLHFDNPSNKGSNGHREFLHPNPTQSVPVKARAAAISYGRHSAAETEVSCSHDAEGVGTGEESSYAGDGSTTRPRRLEKKGNFDVEFRVKY